MLYSSCGLFYSVPRCTGRRPCCCICGAKRFSPKYQQQQQLHDLYIEYVFTWRMKPRAVTTIASRKPNKNKEEINFYFLLFPGSISFWSFCDVIVCVMYIHTLTPRLYSIHSVCIAYEMRFITPSERNKNSAQKKSMNVKSKQNEKRTNWLCSGILIALFVFLMYCCWYIVFLFICCFRNHFVYTRCWSAKSHCEVVDPARHISFSSLVDTQRQKALTLTGQYPSVKKRNSGQNCLRADRPADTHTHVSGITDGWTDGFVERVCCMEERSCLLGSRSKYLLNSIQQPAWASWMNHQGHEAASALDGSSN